MVYADDIVILGRDPQKLITKIKEKGIRRRTGKPTIGEPVEFLGRRLNHNGDSIVLISGKRLCGGHLGRAWTD